MRLVCRLLFVWTGILIFVGCHTGGRKPASSAQADSNQLGRQRVEQMIAEFGPIIYLSADEKYLMDDPEYVLDNGASLAWGVVENAGRDNYKIFQVNRLESKRTSSRTFMDDVRVVENTVRSYPNGEKYKYWLHIDDSMIGGSLARAKALVRVLPASALSTEIQFWFYYPFNGPGRVRVCAASTMCGDNWLEQSGRHYGDWEEVVLLVSNATKQLTSVYMSRHGDSEVFNRADNGVFTSASDRKRTLQFDGSHPIVYAAVSSHAHYPTPKQYNYYEKRLYQKKWGLGIRLGTASADLFDRTAKDKEFKSYEPGRYRIISSDLPDLRVVEPEWLKFSGNWGQYEKLKDVITFKKYVAAYEYTQIGNGVTGPKLKKTGNDHLLWNGHFDPTSQ